MRDFLGKEGPREQQKPSIGNSQGKSEVERGMFTGQRGDQEVGGA